MKHKLLVYKIIVLLSLPYYCFSQHHKELIEIIQSNYSIESRQQKIDSFLKVNEQKLSSEVLADCYHDLGSKWYFGKWKKSRNIVDIEKAIQSTNQALSLKQNGDGKNHKSIKKTLYNLGYFNSLKGDVFESINAYTTLTELGEQDQKTQSAYRELGVAYRSIGDFHKALASINNVVLFYQNDTLSRSRLILSHLKLAETYSLMGFKEYSEQISEHLQKTDSIIKRIDKNLNLEKRINQIEGNRLLAIGKYKNAIKSHLKVLKSLKKGQDSIEKSIVYNSLGISHLHLPDSMDATLKYFKTSISYNPNYTPVYENLGDYYVKKNEFKQGLYNYQKAIIYAIDKNRTIKFDDTLTIKDVELASQKIYLLNHIITKANAWVKYYQYDKNKQHLDQALNTFALADQLIDVIRFESTEYQSKLFWREKGASLYMKAVEVCHLLDKPERAYYFMEKNKALLLLEDITNEQAKEITKLPNSIAKREYELKRNIYLSENELQNNLNTAPDEISGLKNKIYEHKRDYDKFIDSLKVVFPEYARLKNKTQILPYQHFKKKYVSDEEFVLQYILNNEQGYGLLSAPNLSVFFQLKNIKQINHKIAELYNLLTDLTPDHKKSETYAMVSNQVFQELIPKEVYKLIKGQRVTIIPDYILQQIPFETFVVDIENKKYLIEDTEIRYAYSLSYLDIKKKVNQNPEKLLLGFAPVTFDDLKLKRLFFSKEELKDVEAIYSGDILYNNTANKNNFIKNLNNYKIIHLSTHADIEEKGNHWIAFSDKKMFLKEIYATKNQADMVVLSACNTSLGELKQGEGVMSLARGFFHSGAKSIVSSLWPISDKNSKEIIVDFYKGLDQGLTKSAALRKAKLKYINTYRDSNASPGFWGALIIIGDNKTINAHEFYWKYWLFAGVAILLLCIVSYYHFRKRRVK